LLSRIVWPGLGGADQLAEVLGVDGVGRPKTHHKTATLGAKAENLKVF
jgi:hypothetical protein